MVPRGEAFRQQMLEQIGSKLGEHHSGELRRECADARAERIVAEELDRLGWRGAELAARVHLGSSKSASARLHR